MKKIIVFAAMALLLSTTVSAQLMNGSFEESLAEEISGFKTLVATNSNISVWSIGLIGVDWIEDYWQASEGERSVDLNGTVINSDGSIGDAAGSVSQSLATEKNLTYTITFDMSGNPDGGPPEKTITVTAAGASEPFAYNTATNGNTKLEMKYTPYSFKFTATETTTVLTFESTTDGSFGPVIDNVAISSVSGEVCHRNFGKKEQKTLTVGASAIPAHLAHGDTACPCPVAP